MKIENIGSYIETDEEGYLINPTSAEKIQEEWRPVIDSVTHTYINNFGVDLKSVYIRGSVAKGTAIMNISDIDTFAIVDLPKEKINNKWVHDAEKDIVSKFPFATGVELTGVSASDIPKNVKIILNQALLVYGEPQDFPRMKMDKDLAIHAPNIEGRLKSVSSFFENDKTADEIKDFCAWIMKGYLRIGLEILIEKSGKYSRDLYKCYEVFSEYYPDKKDQMREILELAIEPTSDKKTILRISENLGEWLLSEAKRNYG